MSDGPTVRAALAAVVAAVVPDDTWTIYSAPPELLSLPAVVIVPRVPYRVDGPAWCEEQYGLDVVILAPRSQGVPGFDLVDVVASLAQAALLAVPGLIYEGTDMGPMIQPGGVECAGATIHTQYYVPMEV